MHNQFLKNQACKKRFFFYYDKNYETKVLQKRNEVFINEGGGDERSEEQLCVWGGEGGGVERSETCWRVQPP